MEYPALPATPVAPRSASTHGAGKPGGAAAITVRLMEVEFVKLPDVPVIVTVTVPVVAVLVAESVKVLLVVVGFVVKMALTPDGNVEVESVTLPLKPFCGATETVVVPLPACTMLTLFGEADSAKLGGATAFTVRATVVVAVRVPDVPVTVTVAGPVVAELLAVNVNVLLPVAGFGLKAAVTPFGSADVLKVTLPLNPFCGVMVIVLVPVAP